MYFVIVVSFGNGVIWSYGVVIINDFVFKGFFVVKLLNSFDYCWSNGF